MGTINIFTAESYITQIFSEYLDALQKAKKNKKKLIPEATNLFEGMDDFKTFIKSPDLQFRVYNRLNLDGIKELFSGCCYLAKAYELESYNRVKDCEVTDNKHYFNISSAVTSFSTGGLYTFKLDCISEAPKKWYQYYGKAWYCYKLNPSTNKYEEYVEGLGEYKALLDTNTNDRAFLFKEPGRYKITASVFQNSWNPHDGVYGKLNEVETIEINVIDDVDPAIANLGTSKKYIRAINYANWGEAFGDLAKDIAAIAGTIMLFMGIGIILKKIPAGKLKPFLIKIAKKLALPELLTFFGTVGDAFDVAACVGAICSFDEQVRNAKNEEHLKLAGKTWEKVVETFGLVAVMTFMNVVGRKMKKSDVEKEITSLDSIPDRTIDEDAIVKKYLEKLDEKSIRKLTRRDDGYEILKKYEAYFGDNIDFVNELIQNTPGKEIYVEPETLIQKYIGNTALFNDCKKYTKQIQRLNCDELQELINEAKKITNNNELKDYILDTVLTPAERAASWQGSGNYPGVDKYVDKKLPKGYMLYILQSQSEFDNNSCTGYATDLITIDSSGRDAKLISRKLQVKPFYDKKAKVGKYREFAFEYEIKDNDFIVAYGKETLANPQYGEGGASQYFVKKVQEAIKQGKLQWTGNKIKLNNNIISGKEYADIMNF